MQLIKNGSEINFDKNTIITIGTFDGVHIGHQKILNQLIEDSRNKKYRSVLITFDPHPREIVGRGPTKLLTTLEERIEILSTFDLDYVYIINFTYEFSRLHYYDFYREYIHDKIGVKEVIVGYDHMFGRDREATFEQLKELANKFDFKVKRIKPVSVDGQIVSSSKIREIIFRGDVCLAEKYLGRFYSVKGLVVEGDGRGKLLGFPTANIQPLSDKKLIPAEGVYFVKIKLQNKFYYGMLNIGVRPTFEIERKKVIEVNIFNFEGEIYSNEVDLYFLRRLRSEIKFNSKEELIEQLKKDKLQCEKYIKEINKN
ncbi:MAG: Riboflavin kinase [Ignavibacteriae bacterium]|nr:MAG: Riboflavin kinase [Ignavibacteriota bacterium]